MSTQPWGQNPAPPVRPPQWGQTPPPQRPKRSRRKFWLVIGGIIAGLWLIGTVAGEDTTPTASPATTGPATTAPTTAAPATIAEPLKATSPPTTAKPKPIVYRRISARQWALIAKNPDAHDSEHIVVHGQITQFDAATGPDTFRADVDGAIHQPEYGFVDYPTNTILYGDAAELTDLVEGDLFTARVRIAGSQSYDTQIGGNTTVPLLQITTIRVIGHLD